MEAKASVEDLGRWYFIHTYNGSNFLPRDLIVDSIEPNNRAFPPPLPLLGGMAKTLHQVCTLGAGRSGEFGGEWTEGMQMEGKEWSGRRRPHGTVP